MSNGLADRFIIIGDSIACGVYSDCGIGDPSKLWVNQLPGAVGSAVNNLSSPGQRITQGGQVGFGVAANLNAVTTVVGFSGAKAAIITAGTNDYTHYGTSLVEYIEAHRSVIAHCRSLGLEVIVVSPIWRADLAVEVLHVDGNHYSMESFRVYGEMVAAEEKAKPGPAVHILTGLDAPLMPEHYVADQLHLNSSGHDVFFGWLVGRMQALGYWE